MEKSNEQLKKENQALKEQVVQLQTMVKLLQNQLFGKKTEVIEKVIDGQQSLFNDDELDRLQEPAVKGGLKLSFYGGLKMHDLGGLVLCSC